MVERIQIKDRDEALLALKNLIDLMKNGAGKQQVSEVVDPSSPGPKKCFQRLSGCGETK